jgi:uncharacterized protein
MDPRPGSRTIAVVGSGVAGLTTAWLLARRHRVTLFERDGRLGGHTRTLTVPDGPDAGTPIDTGFIVMNHRNYPLFTRLLERLGVPLEDSDMSFSFTDSATSFCWAGTNLPALFATPSSLLSPRHWGMIRDILRFNRQAQADLAGGALGSVTLGDYVAGLGLGAAFRERYLYAMGAAIWSCPLDEAARFPAEAYLHFFLNHGLLSVNDRPQWRFVKGGSRSYVERMRGELGEVRLRSRVESVTRENGGVVLRAAGEAHRFDAIVLAAHANETLRLLADPSNEEQDLLGAWRFSENEVVLHRDPSVMPPRRAAWASWNVVREPAATSAHPVSLSYHMNRLQNLRTQHPYFVSLNRRLPIRDDAVIDRTVLTHPVYSFASLASQSRLRALNGTRSTWYAGAWLGYGFHEDAVRSAVQIAEAFDCPL